MPNEREIKAIFSLLESEPARKEQLSQSLLAFYKQNPQQVYNFALEYYGKLPSFIKDLFESEQNKILLEEIKHFLNLKNPDLLEGLFLLSKIINPQISKEQAFKNLNLAREDFDKFIDSSFEICQKAQVLQSFFFETLNFQIYNLQKQKELFYLPEIFKNFKTTPLVLAIIYLVFVKSYEVKADIFEAQNKVFVRLQDSFTLEAVYIDIINRGRFVSQAECDMYAAGNFIKWDSSDILPLTNTAVFKTLFSSLLTSLK